MIDHMAAEAAVADAHRAATDYDGARAWQGARPGTVSASQVGVFLTYTGAVPAALVDR